MSWSPKESPKDQASCFRNVWFSRTTQRERSQTYKILQLTANTHFPPPNSVKNFARRGSFKSGSRFSTMHKAAIQQNSSQFIRIIANFDTELTTQPLALGVPSQNPLIMSCTFANNKGLISRKPLMMSLSLLQRNWVRFALHPFKTGWRSSRRWPIG